MSSWQWPQKVFPSSSCLYPQSVTTPVFSFHLRSNFLNKTSTYTTSHSSSPFTFWSTSVFHHYFPEIILFRVTKMTLSKNPMDTTLGLILVNLSSSIQYSSFWNNLIFRLLCPYSLLVFLLALRLLLFSIPCKPSLLNQSSLSHRMPSFLYTRSWQIMVHELNLPCCLFL